MIGRAIIVIISLIASVGVIEAGLRAARWPAPGFYRDGRGPLPLAAPGSTGGAYPPNVSGRLRHYDYDVEWSVNGDGFRERPRQRKQPGEQRIGILGDSFAAGFGVERQNRFSDVWQAHRSPVGTTLWNLASPNCGTACAAAILEGIGSKYELDEIILAFYGGNDLSDNIEWQMAKAGGAGEHARADGMRAWVREHSRAATFAWVYLLRGFASLSQPGIYSTESLEASWPSTQVALTHLQDVAGTRPLRIWYIPTIPEWDDRVWSAIREQYTLPAEGRHAVKEALQAWADRQNVEFTDTSLWLHGCGSASHCTFPIDGHWNAEAHRMVGDGLAAVTR